MLQKLRLRRRQPALDNLAAHKGASGVQPGPADREGEMGFSVAWLQSWNGADGENITSPFDDFVLLEKLGIKPKFLF
jgi:hypothetical protein